MQLNRSSFGRPFAPPDPRETWGEQSVTRAVSSSVIYFFFSPAGASCEGTWLHWEKRAIHTLQLDNRKQDVGGNSKPGVGKGFTAGCRFEEDTEKEDLVAELAEYVFGHEGRPGCDRNLQRVILSGPPAWCSHRRFCFF